MGVPYITGSLNPAKPSENYNLWLGVAYLHTSPIRIHSPIAGLRVLLRDMPPSISMQYNNLMTWIKLNNYQTVPPENVDWPGHMHDLYDDFKQTGLAHCHPKNLK